MHLFQYAFQSDQQTGIYSIVQISANFCSSVQYVFSFKLSGEISTSYVAFMSQGEHSHLKNDRSSQKEPSGKIQTPICHSGCSLISIFQFFSIQ